MAGSVGGSAGELGDGGSTNSTDTGGTSSSSGGSGTMGDSSSGGGAGAGTDSSSGGAAGTAGSSSGGGAGSSSGGSAGSSTTGTGGEGGTPEAAFVAFCEAYTEYMCEWMLGCRDFPDCESSGPAGAIRSACETLPQPIADGDLVFDVELAESCLPDELVCYSSPRDLTDVGPCRGVVHAKGKIGDDCYLPVGWVDQPCAEGYCDTSDQCPGTCKAYLPDESPCDGLVPCEPGSACVDTVCTKLPAAGESCEASCLHGFPCVEADDGKLCVQPRADGDECDDGHPCVASYGCVEGVCGAKLELGDECLASVQCPDATRCLPYGDSGMNTCQTLPDVGEPCPSGECNDALDVSCQDPDPSDDDDTRYCGALGGVDDPCGAYGCRSDLWCYYAENDTDGVCLPLGGPGDFCTTEGTGPFAGYTPCLSYPNLYICMEEECAPPGAIGEPCLPTDWQSCAEGWCSTATSRCVEPGGEGDVCNTTFAYGDACAEGLYCSCEADECYADPLLDHGECLTKKATDALCETSIECSSDNCAWDGEVGRCAEVVDQSACIAPYAPEP
ncbi:MAG TPA: hypothetical protein VFU02_10750 [Polyangiaceae bacterium]|nr:hypothetical protein [Polyangiaceae bacterium]